MTTRRSSGSTVTRRTVLVSAAAMGAASALVACGDDGTPASSSGNTSSVTVPAGDVPVGGGTIVADQKVVVTQPTQGSYTAFTAVCTHQGCIVARVENAQIMCTCHNSAFSVADGTVVSGPAQQPLTAKTVTVNGDTLTVA